MEEIRKLREEAVRQCQMPTRYTSDKDVIDSPEETAVVQAEWDAYFKQVADVLQRHPYTKEDTMANDRIYQTEYA